MHLQGPLLWLLIAIVAVCVVTAVAVMTYEAPAQPVPNVKCFITEGHPQTIECRCG